MEVSEIDEMIGGGSQLFSCLVTAARAGHLCIEGGEVDCEVEVLKGREEWFAKKVGKWGNRFYLQRNWVLENRVVREFKRLLKEEVKRIDTGEFEGLNEKQREGVERGLSEGVLCLTGGPGTGKTFTLEKIVKRFPGSVCVCAPTGKAVALLREKLGGDVGTLHQMLGVRSGKDVLFGEGVLDYDMVIVDECSMIDVGMGARLLGGIRSGTRLILVGDHEQLPPVEAGTVFGELCSFMKERGKGYVHLEMCMRSDRREVVELAEKVRKGEVIPYGELKDGVEKLWDEGYQLLSCLRRGRYGVESMNRLLVREGEKPVIMTRTNRSLGISNGEMGVLRGEEIVMGERRFKEALVPDYEWGYCLSVHKSQGSEFNKVALLVPKGSEVFGREILYTGITRAKEEVLVLSEEGVIEECVTISSEKMSGIREKLRCDF